MYCFSHHRKKRRYVNVYQEEQQVCLVSHNNRRKERYVKVYQEEQQVCLVYTIQETMLFQVTELLLFYQKGMLKQRQNNRTGLNSLFTDRVKAGHPGGLDSVDQLVFKQRFSENQFSHNIVKMQNCQPLDGGIYLFSFQSVSFNCSMVGRSAGLLCIYYFSVFNSVKNSMQKMNLLLGQPSISQFTLKSCQPNSYQPVNPPFMLAYLNKLSTP